MIIIATLTVIIVFGLCMLAYYTPDDVGSLFDTYQMNGSAGFASAGATSAQVLKAGFSMLLIGCVGRGGGGGAGCRGRSGSLGCRCYLLGRAVGRLVGGLMGRDRILRHNGGLVGDGSMLLIGFGATDICAFGAKYMKAKKREQK